MDPALLDTISHALTQILVPVLISYTSVAIMKLTRWINVKAHGTQVEGSLRVLTDLVDTVVRELEQTTVKAFRDSNGSLDAATAEKVRQAALDKIKEWYGTRGLEELTKRLGTTPEALLSFILAKIEASVYAMRTLPPFGAMTPDERAAAGAPPILPAFGGMTPSEKAAVAATPP